ncbi:hypothetical protein HDU89_000014 [Geranomyces variabilis]|nr:hypothetical protein HDU89_000014 [Geranomyces variabilis]
MAGQTTSFYMENGAASSTAEIQQAENPSSAASIRFKKLNFNAIGTEFNELRGRPVNKIKQRFSYLMKKQQKGSSKEK